MKKYQLVFLFVFIVLLFLPFEKHYINNHSVYSLDYTVTYENFFEWSLQETTVNYVITGGLLLFIFVQKIVSLKQQRTSVYGSIIFLVWIVIKQHYYFQVKIPFPIGFLLIFLLLIVDICVNGYQKIEKYSFKKDKFLISKIVFIVSCCILMLVISCFYIKMDQRYNFKPDIGFDHIIENMNCHSLSEKCMPQKSVSSDKEAWEFLSQIEFLFPLVFILLLKIPALFQLEKYRMFVFWTNICLTFYLCIILKLQLSYQLVQEQHIIFSSLLLFSIVSIIMENIYMAWWIFKKKKKEKVI